ncbi:ABC transporter ATP-binding protein [Sinosporangium siamense]|uniref:ABC transporter ATP-binding protein n=1 Tax=Sinosporangium siamense TaxID=1367973 RepID=A0A919V5I8_9ACTN|nr:ABC transporter ATP-binding protein [Sinosporangium siamense]GII90916.1 ABC transporter ATP-binding protein [Sinosporangium siamense]
MPVLEVDNITKLYGESVAVDTLSFTIDQGETYGLLGPNGAGKTTAISMIVGVLDRDAGQVRVGGRPHSPADRRSKALIGYVPQDLALYHDISARENLRFFTKLYGMSRAAAAREIERVLEAVGLADRADDAVRTYSGGMARRLNIAIGLLHRPKLLILDEPTVGVDPQSRNAILASVRELAGEGVAILYTTHYMEEAERLCDRIGILDGGRLRAEGTRRELVGLVGEHDQVVFKVEGDPAHAVPVLEAAPGVGRVQRVEGEDGEVVAFVADARAAMTELMAAVAAGGVAVRSVEVREPDLEAVFLHLTGRALRD